MLLNEGEAGWTLTRQVEPTFAGSFPTVVIGGMPIAALSIDETVSVMLKAVRERPRGHRPLYMTSANGEVIARYHDEPAVAALFDKADLINADGQPMVIASRLLSDQPLPERVATTDLFDAVVSMFSHTDVDDFSAVVREAARVLRPEAVFVYVGLHPCFVGPHSVQRHQAVPTLHAGYGKSGRYTEGPGISPDGLWAKVTGVHLPLGRLMQAFLDAPLALERFEEHGDDDYPRRVAIRARRQV